MDNHKRLLQTIAENKTEKFTISKYDKDGVFEPATVEGKRITIEGIECFIFKDGDEFIYEWNISHIETGFRMGAHLSKEEAIKKVTGGVKNHWASVYKRALDACEDLGIKLPVNT